MGTILVADDDEHIREFLRRSCGQLATVVEAADGAQAIAAARWSHPDVIVMDLDMPVFDGFEAARQIKCDPTLGDPILVALTGNETFNAVHRARAAGFSYFVRKETNARSFVETIARLLEQALARARPSPSDVSPAGPAPAASSEAQPAQPGRPRRASPSRVAGKRTKAPDPRKASGKPKPAGKTKSARSSSKPAGKRSAGQKPGRRTRSRPADRG
jgi:CheY-like chemotaxis protein